LHKKETFGTVFIFKKLLAAKSEKNGIKILIRTFGKVGFGQKSFEPATLMKEKRYKNGVTQVFRNNKLSS
jgi:hypothetical protein